jgi:hypothetical protein
MIDNTDIIDGPKMIDGTTPSMFGFGNTLVPAPLMWAAWEVSLNHTNFI